MLSEKTGAVHLSHMLSVPQELGPVFCNNGSSQSYVIEYAEFSTKMEKDCINEYRF
jgi:hypothetical protein